MITHPRARTPPRSAPPTAGSTRSSATRRSTSTRACRARLGVPVIVKVETINPIRSFKGRGTWIARRRAGGGGEDRPRPADRVRLGRQLRAGRRLRRPRARHPGRRVRLAQREPAARSQRMRDLGAEVITVGEDFDAARAASEAYAAEHPRRAARRRRRPADLDRRRDPGARADRRGRGRRPAGARRRRPCPVGNGALINGVGSWLRAELPACRVVGIQAEGAAGDDPELPGGPADRHRRRRHVRRRDRRRGSPSRAPSS